MEFCIQILERGQPRPSTCRCWTVHFSQLFCWWRPLVGPCRPPGTHPIPHSLVQSHPITHSLVPCAQGWEVPPGLGPLGTKPKHAQRLLGSEIMPCILNNNISTWLLGGRERRRISARLETHQSILQKWKTLIWLLSSKPSRTRPLGPAAVFGEPSKRGLAVWVKENQQSP